MKPLLNVARTEDELREKEVELNRMREKAVKEEQARKEMEEGHTKLIEEKNDLFIQLQRVRRGLADRVGVTVLNIFLEIERSWMQLV